MLSYTFTSDLANFEHSPTGATEVNDCEISSGQPPCHPNITFDNDGGRRVDDVYTSAITSKEDEKASTTTNNAPTYATVQSMLQILEKRASNLQSERDQAERAYENARRSVDDYKAMVAQYSQEKRDMQLQTQSKTGPSTIVNIGHLANPPLISRLPLELLIYIFLYVQNTVVTSQVCRYWRHITHSSPRLWSSLHIHPSKGAKYLEQLLERSRGNGPGIGGGVGLDVCFCPVLPPQLKSNHSHPHPHLHPRAHLSHSPVFAFHPSMVLNPQIVSTLMPHVSRLSSFEIHATVPGTWLTLLPMLELPAPELRRMCVFTTLPGDVAQIGFFGHHLRLGRGHTSTSPLQGVGHQHSTSYPQSGTSDSWLRGKPDPSYNPTPKLRNLQMTGGFPLLYHTSLLRNLTVLRLEAVPLVYRPNTRQLRGILEACQGLVALSLLDAGPVPDPTSPPGARDDTESDRISMKSLKALSFRDTEIHTGIQPQAGTVFNTQNGFGVPVVGMINTPTLAGNAAAYPFPPVPGIATALPPSVSTTTTTLHSMPSIAHLDGGMAWFLANVHMPNIETLQVTLGPHPLAFSPAARGFLPSPSPIPQAFPMGAYRLSPSTPAPAPVSVSASTPTSTYPQASPNPYPHGQLSINALAVGKTRVIFDYVRLLDSLRELYLWTPHADARDIKGLLSGLKRLQSLEIPVVRDPLSALHLFMPPSNAEHPEEIALTATASSTFDTMQDMPVCVVDDKDVGGSEWLCPNLEKMGLPYINGVPQPRFEHALKEVIKARTIFTSETIHHPSPSSLPSTIDRSGVVPLKSILAPGGRPHYVCEDMWRWIGERMRIETIQSSETTVSGEFSAERMDTLFDRIVREAS
ncbi:hypothetical protein FRC17_000428 [Serendipita sp. 399]|nr:hypothetical protein FRC17_000428 [Serendipita sp. 399]